MLLLSVIAVCMVSVATAQYYPVDSTSLGIINGYAETKIREELVKVYNMHVALLLQANYECELLINDTIDMCQECGGNIGFWDGVWMATMQGLNAGVQETNQHVLQPAVGGVVSVGNSINNEVFQPIGGWTSGAINSVGNFFVDGWKWTVGAGNSIGDFFSGRRKRSLGCRDCQDLDGADSDTVIQTICGDAYVTSSANYIATATRALEIYNETVIVDVVTKVEYDGTSYNPAVNGFSRNTATYNLYTTAEIDNPATYIFGQYEAYGNATAIKILESLEW